MKGLLPDGFVGPGHAPAEAIPRSGLTFHNRKSR